MSHLWSFEKFSLDNGVEFFTKHQSHGWLHFLSIELINVNTKLALEKDEQVSFFVFIDFRIRWTLVFGCADSWAFYKFLKKKESGEAHWTCVWWTCLKTPPISVDKLLTFRAFLSKSQNKKLQAESLKESPLHSLNSPSIISDFCQLPLKSERILKKKKCFCEAVWCMGS